MTNQSKNNEQLEVLTKEVKELRQLIVKQNLQNKKMMFVMVINLYLIVTVLAYFLLIK